MANITYTLQTALGVRARPSTSSDNNPVLPALTDGVPTTIQALDTTNDVQAEGINWVKLAPESGYTGYMAQRDLSRSDWVYLTPNA